MNVSAEGQRRLKILWVLAFSSASSGWVVFSINFWPSDKFPERCKWDSSQQQKLWEQLKACRLGRKSNNNNNNKPTKNQKMQRRLQLLGTNEKTEKISALNPQEFCWRWTRYPTLLKQKIYLLSFISCTPAQLHFKPVPLAFNSFSFSSFPFSFPIFSVQSNSSR